MADHPLLSELIENNPDPLLEILTNVFDENIINTDEGITEELKEKLENVFKERIDALGKD